MVHLWSIPVTCMVCSVFAGALRGCNHAHELEMARLKDDQHKREIYIANGYSWVNGTFIKLPSGGQARPTP